MSRTGGLALLFVALLPLAAEAQSKPSNSMHTRSAEVYLGRAAATSRPDEKQKLYTEALEAIAPALESDANNPKVWLLAGQAHAGLGNVAAADSAFDKAEALYPEYAAEIDPERLNLWIRDYNAGVEAIQAGNEDAAIAAFEQADRVYRKRPDALISLGPLYTRKGDLAKAEQAYRDALAVIRGPAGQGLDEKTAAEWRENEEVASAQLANLLAETGKAEEAAAIYRELLERQPDNLQAKNNLAVVLSRAGNQDEASKIYADLLSQPDLDDVTLFNIGVGLYRSEQYENAAQAFRRALEKNPHSYEALYNLGQALVAAAAPLNTTTDAAKLRPMYEELLQVAEKLIALGPANRNAYMMQAQAQRSVGELVQDAAQSEEWKKKVLATLEQAEALQFDVAQLALEPAEGSATLKGSLTNAKLAAGAPVTLRFTFVDATGATIATQDVSLQAPAPQQSAEFTIEVKTDRPIAGWKYTVTTG
jgi:tetratricopeptide (TPR) repeat protein